jgi:hypothetical protein
MMCVGDDQVKKAVAQQLHSQFDRTACWEGGLVED